MKDLTIIVPLHLFNEGVKKECENSFAKLKAAIDTYKYGDVYTYTVSPREVIDDKLFQDFIESVGFQVSPIPNDGPTDFCSQVNHAVSFVKTDHFSIMEFDDEYSPKWFNMAHDYFVGDEAISIMLPVNLYHNEDDEDWQYGNTMALTPAFLTDNENDTDPIGYINKYRIEGSSLFNLTGAIFNRKDFIDAGRFKPSVEVAFNYELLLRMTGKGLKAFVAPKEGYVHEIGRKGSLGDTYMSKYGKDDVDRWFHLAERESKHDEDRGLGIDSINTETLK